MDWILVAAINPHNPISWGYTQIVDGTCRLALAMDDTHNGAHVIPGFVPLFVIPKYVKLESTQNAFGILPTINWIIFTYI